MRHKGFAENQQLFLPYFALREEFDHLRAAQQLDFLHLLPRSGPGFGTFEVPKIKIEGQEDSERLGEVLKAGEYPMRFDGEPEIWGLDKMVSGYPSCFLGHFLLVTKAEKVFND